MAQHETAQQPTELEHLTLRVNDLEAKLAALSKRVTRIEVDFYEDTEDPNEPGD